jgi:hypothetical protein
MKTLLFCLIFCANTAFAATPNANDIAKNLRENQYSEGFQARFNVLRRNQKGAIAAPMQLILIGQVNAQQRRFLLRSLSANKPLSPRIFIEQTQTNPPKVLRLNAAEETPSLIQPNEPLLELSLQASDLLSPWWSWQHSLGSTLKINGKECQILHSVNPSTVQNLAYHRAESCIDLQQNMALRIQIFNPENIEVRRIDVLQTLKKSNGRGYVAKKFTLTDQARKVTEFEIYSGDDEYQITAETFATLKFATH